MNQFSIIIFETHTLTQLSGNKGDTLRGWGWGEGSGLLRDPSRSEPCVACGVNTANCRRKGCFNKAEGLESGEIGQLFTNNGNLSEKDSGFLSGHKCIFTL